MKHLFPLFISFSFCTIAIGQVPFTPIGARWVGKQICGPGGPPPYFYNYIVTKDSTIQGKYCTLLGNEWPCSFEGVYVHQDGDKIFRYDAVEEEFKLVLDYSKQVGESWEVEICDDIFPNDTVTITVQEINSNYRLVSAKCGSWERNDLPLYEGFGGLVFNNRLLLSEDFFIIADPSCDNILVCYEDPTEGVIYGTGESCLYNAMSDPHSHNHIWLNVFPNPADDEIQLHYNLPVGEKYEWVLLDAVGRAVYQENLSPYQQQAIFSVSEIPPGLYFWQVQSEGKWLKAGKITFRK